jgi:hypothetical protein
MKTIKVIGLVLGMTIMMALVGFGQKAQAAYYGNYDWNNYSSQYRNYYPYNNMYNNNYYNRYFDSRYSNYYDYYRTSATYPRTVYLIDSSNSANQLNIINSTRGGSTTAAYVTVPSYVYNRVVNDYNQLGAVSVRVDRNSNMVTFYTVNGTFSTYAVNISWQ